MSKFKDEKVEVYLTVKIIEKPEIIGKTPDGEDLMRVVAQYRGQKSRKSKINLVYPSGIGQEFVLNGFYNINADVRTRLQLDGLDRKYSEVYLTLIDARQLDGEPEEGGWCNRVKFENLILVCDPFLRKAYNDENADVCLLTLKRRKTNSVSYFYSMIGWYDHAQRMGEYRNGERMTGYGNLQGRYVDSVKAYKTDINISKLG